MNRSFWLSKSPQFLIVGVFVAAIVEQLAFLLYMPILTTFDLLTLIREMIDIKTIESENLFGFPFLGYLSQINQHDTLTVLLALQCTLSVIAFVSLQMLVIYYDRITSLICSAILIFSLSPFIFSMWIMNDHLYMVLIIFIIVSYGMIVETGRFSYVFLCAAVVWLAQHTRPVGALLQIVLALSIIGSLCLDRAWFKRRLWQFAALGSIIVVLTLATTYKLSPHKETGALTQNLFNTSASTSGRWLFCQIYGRDTEAGRPRLSLESTPSMRFIAEVVREQLGSNPGYLSSFITRWGGPFVTYQGNSGLLADDLINNAPPEVTHRIGGQGSCWAIFDILDQTIGADRTNLLLFNAWAEASASSPDIWLFYVVQTVKFFFQVPDERSVVIHSNDIGVSQLRYRTYSQIYGVGLKAEDFNVAHKINYYVLSFVYFGTPVLSILSLIGLPVTLGNNRYAPVLLLCWAIVIYHGIAVAMSNVITMRYVYVIYPPLVLLASVGLRFVVQLSKLARRNRPLEPAS